MTYAVENGPTVIGLFPQALCGVCVRNRRGGSCPAFTVSSDPCPPPLIQRTLSGWHQTRCGFPGPGPSPHSLSLQLKRIGMDLIGPLERSARGHRFALVLVDYATRYPEAVPLRTISAKSVADWRTLTLTARASIYTGGESTCVTSNI